MKYIYMFLCALLAACASDLRQNSSSEQPVSRLLYPYNVSSQCGGCHADQHAMYEESMHSKAFTNPLFNAQYFNDIVPRAQRDRSLIPEARRCVACHAPTVFMNYTGLVSSPAQAANFETGVTCDFCHTLAGYAENGDYKQVASGKKQGPFVSSNSSHSEYSGFIGLGEFCGRCHDATNHIGLAVKSTYSEWRESSYGRRGFSCQECHMNKDGFLGKGNTAEFEKGAAAYMNVGSVAKRLQERDRLYNHSFPGAHSKSQLTNALNLEFKILSRKADFRGLLPFTLLVNNERSGHKMPTGSSDLRFMWLVVTATATDGTRIPAYVQRSTAANVVDYSISGGSPDDAEVLQDDVPDGSRLYRTVLLNAVGRQSLYQYDAINNAFDNRLKAEEVRKEGYYLKIPATFSGMVTLEARLYYKGAPNSFTKRLLVPDVHAVLVASQKKQILIEAANTPNE